MRTRLIPTSLLALSLTVALPAAAAAQDDASDPDGVAFFTGTIGDSTLAEPPTEEFTDGGVVVRGLVWVDTPVEATDPRFDGTLSREMNIDVHFLSDIEDITVQSTAYLLENEAGSWAGTATSLTHGGRDIEREDATDVDTVILTGSGDYEGLSAYVLTDWTEEPTAFEAAIFAGEMPPFPEPFVAGEAPTGHAAGSLAEIDALLTEDVVGDAPGAVTALAIRDGETLASAAGSANSNGSPVSVDTAFRVGSISKSFTATMVMQLVDEGLVDLDEPLSTYLPDTRVGGDVTIRQLLSHTSGVASYTDQDGYFDSLLADVTRTYSYDEIIDVVADVPHEEPGGDFSYSNTNYILLGQLIETVGGDDLETALQTRIVEPAGLQSTTFGLDAESLPEDFAAPWFEDVFVGDPEADYEAFSSSAWSAGALVSSASDLALFTDALFAGTLVSEDALAQMLDVGPEGYGLGIGTMPPGSEPGAFYGHNGSIHGYNAFLAADPDTGDTVVVLSSVLDQDPWWAFEAILDGGSASEG